MKKLLAILLSVVMVMSLFAACGNDDDDEDGDGKSSSYTDPVDRAMKGICCELTKSECKAMFPDEYWEENDFDEYWENTEAQLDSSRERMEEQIGKNAEYSYEITSKEEIEDLSDIQASLNEKYGIPEEDVEQAYSLDFDFTIKGSDDEVNSSSSDSVVVCIRGEWYQYPF